MHTHAHTHCTLTHIRNGQGRGLTTTVNRAKKVNTDREPEQEGPDAPELREFRQWPLRGSASGCASPGLHTHFTQLQRIPEPGQMVLLSA